MPPLYVVQTNLAHCRQGCDFSVVVSSATLFVNVVILFRKAESREPSPEATPYHKAADGLDQSTSETMPSIDFAAANAVIDDAGHFHLPEPPDLGAYVQPDTLLPADGAQQLAEDSHMESENASRDNSTSETTVCFRFIYPRQRRRYTFMHVFVCLSVCLSVSKITQKGVHGFG